MGQGMGNEGSSSTANDNDIPERGIGRRLRAGGTSAVVVFLVVFLVVAVLATTVGATSVADSTGACHRSDTGAVEGVTVTGIATDDGDCIVDTETLVVTFEPTTLTASLGLDAFVVVDRNPESVDDELDNVDVRKLGDDRYRVEIPRDSLAAVTDSGDAGLQIEIRTRTVLPTGPGDTLLVRLHVDVGTDGILDGEEETDGDGETQNDPDETSDGDGSADNGASDGDSTDGADDAGGEDASNDLEESSGGDGSPDSADDTGAPDAVGTSEFGDQANGSTETPTPTPTPTPTSTPTAVGAPASGQDLGSASESSLGTGALTEGGLPWLLLILIVVVALVVGWRQI